MVVAVVTKEQGKCAITEEEPAMDGKRAITKEDSNTMDDIVMVKTNKDHWKYPITKEEAVMDDTEMLKTNKDYAAIESLKQYFKPRESSVICKEVVTLLKLESGVPEGDIFRPLTTLFKSKDAKEEKLGIKDYAAIESVKQDFKPRELAITCKKVAPHECYAPRKGYLPKGHAMSKLLPFLLSLLLLMSVAYSSDIDEEEIRTCRHDMTHLSFMVCHYPTSRTVPSTACCKSLLHSVDEVPSDPDTGACCFCCYLRLFESATVMVDTYILCGGRDQHIAASWSFPIPRHVCKQVCKSNITEKSPARGGAPAKEYPPLQRSPPAKYPLVLVDTPEGHSSPTAIRYLGALVLFSVVIVLMVAGIAYSGCFKKAPKGRESPPPGSLQMEVKASGPLLHRNR